MRNRAPRGRRRAVLGAVGLLAAGALSGCQSGSAPYAYSGVARGDVGLVPTSPAFAHVAAGQRIPADLKYVPGTPTTVIPSGRSAIPGDGQPVVGSGGVVYSAARSSGATGAGMPSGSTVEIPTVPSVASMPAPAAAWTGGQQTILLVNGPNGPQYLIAEVLASAPAPMPSTPAPVMTATTAGPTGPTGPTSASAPPTPLPTVASAAPVDHAPAPTLNLPPPAIPMPPPQTPAPAVVPVEISRKTPDPLPPAIKSPPDPVLPVSAVSGPSSDSTPPGTFRAAKLPKPTGVTDEDIPPAPAFVPVPK